MRSRVEFHRCRVCGAPRDLRRTVCAHCGIGPSLDDAEQAARRRATLLEAGLRVERRLVASARSLADRLQGLGRRRAGRWLTIAALAVPGLLAAGWLVHRAPSRDALAVLWLFGGAALAPVAFLASSFAVRSDDASFERGDCSSCGWRHDVDPLIGLCPQCLTLELHGQPALDAVDAAAIVDDVDLEDAPLGVCDRCGGDAVLRDGSARCDHCAAPLHPSPELLSPVTERLRAQRAQRRLLRELNALHEGVLADGFERLGTALSWLVGVVVAILGLLAVLYR